MMKRVSATVFVVVIACVQLATGGPATPGVPSIPNGWYDATVTYTTSEQPLPSKFILKVFVRGDWVVAIDLGEQGMIQAGQNDAGYTYSGGQLAIHTDWTTNVVNSATTTVTVVRADGVTLRFVISLRSRPKPQR